MSLKDEGKYAPTGREIPPPKRIIIVTGRGGSGNAIKTTVPARADSLPLPSIERRRSSVSSNSMSGREVATPKRTVMVTGRGGSGNARKKFTPTDGRPAPKKGRFRKSSAQTRDSILDIKRSSTISTFDQFRPPTSNSNFINSDTRSFLSEFTFQTASRRSGSRLSVVSDVSHPSAHSDWFADIRKSYSSESLLAVIQAPPSPTLSTSPSLSPSAMVPPPSLYEFANRSPMPFYQNSGSQSSGSLIGYGARIPNIVAPFDEPPEDLPLPSPAPVTPVSPAQPVITTTKRFKIFRKPAPPVSAPPVNPYGRTHGSLPDVHGSSPSNNGFSRSESADVIDIRRHSVTPVTTAQHALQMVMQSRSDPRRQYYG